MVLIPMKLQKKLAQFTPAQLLWLKRQAKRNGLRVNVYLRQMVEKEMGVEK
jgi:hypothetical protein